MYMEIVAGLLLFSLTAGSGYWYYHRADLSQKTMAWKIVFGLLGAALFLTLFFLVNGYIDNNMPRWFNKFIRTYGDPTGFCLVMIPIGILNYLLAFMIIPAQPHTKEEH